MSGYNSLRQYQHSMADSPNPLPKAPVKLLPPEARNILINASLADLGVRAMEIDRATARVKLMYPQYFL